MLMLVSENGVLAKVMLKGSKIILLHWKSGIK